MTQGPEIIYGKVYQIYIGEDCALSKHAHLIHESYSNFQVLKFFFGFCTEYPRIRSQSVPSTELSDMLRFYIYPVTLILCSAHFDFDYQVFW